MKRLNPKLATLALLPILLCGWGLAAPAANPPTHLVVIENMKYSPATLEVHPGDWVIFRNNGIVPHTITEKPSKAFDSGILNPGEQWKLVVPDREGALRYHCLLHPLMEGSITVVARTGDGTPRSAAEPASSGKPAP